MIIPATTIRIAGIIAKNRPPKRSTRAVGLTIIETCHTTFVNFLTSYIGMNRCSTESLGNGNVYDWIEKIQVRLLWPDFDHSLEQNDLNGHSVGVIFYPSPPPFFKRITPVIPISHCVPHSNRYPYNSQA